MRTAVLGTGIMGAGMARSLAREGHDVAVWNRTATKAEALAADLADQPGGVRAAASVAEAVEGAEVVVTMLYDADSVLEVADELVGALDPGAVWLQATTVGPDGARRIGERSDRLVDAPVLGTRKPAEDGALVVLASGPSALVDAAGPALDAMGSRVVDAGPDVGQASALKLACNSWVALLTAGTAQALGLARALGVDPGLFLDAIGGGAVDTPYAHLKGAAMLGGDDVDGPVSFALDGVRKDLGLMVEAAGGAGFPDELLRAVRGAFDRASEAGHGAADMAAVRTAFEA
ncbi:NAD(P)-dependent oxidoreductase [Nocardioides litoris]|uniref:NAD(P)-dependent oxidoreductase n=1 Tax=Nocardioides litoris TaxID=1926648 RepID=UPI001122DACB|nr:NAD(P)-dependent oxidoreductase [Nocardioides litoris]